MNIEYVLYTTSRNKDFRFIICPKDFSNTDKISFKSLFSQYYKEENLVEKIDRYIIGDYFLITRYLKTDFKDYTGREIYSLEALAFKNQNLLDLKRFIDILVLIENINIKKLQEEINIDLNKKEEEKLLHSIKNIASWYKKIEKNYNEVSVFNHFSFDEADGMTNEFLEVPYDDITEDLLIFSEFINKKPYQEGQDIKKQSKDSIEIITEEQENKKGDLEVSIYLKTQDSKKLKEKFISNPYLKEKDIKEKVEYIKKELKKKKWVETEDGKFEKNTKKTISLKLSALLLLIVIALSTVAINIKSKTEKKKISEIKKNEVKLGVKAEDSKDKEEKNSTVSESAINTSSQALSEGKDQVVKATSDSSIQNQEKLDGNKLKELIKELNKKYTSVSESTFVSELKKVQKAKELVDLEKDLVLLLDNKNLTTETQKLIAEKMNYRIIFIKELEKQKKIEAQDLYIKYPNIKYLEFSSEEKVLIDEIKKNGKKLDELIKKLKK